MNTTKLLEGNRALMPENRYLQGFPVNYPILPKSQKQ